MTLYHFSSHPFEVGDIVEARQSFPFPEAWAWATSSLQGLLEVSKRSEVLGFVVEPLTDDLEPSPYHSDAVRSKTGFKVVAKVDLKTPLQEGNNEY